MKFSLYLLAIVGTVFACSTKKRGVIIDSDRVIQPSQQGPYQTLLIGDSATYVASREQNPIFIYDKKFFELTERERCLDLGEEEKTCLTLYSFEAIASGNTMIEVEVKNGREVVESYRNPILIAERDDQPSDSSLALSDLIGRHLAVIPASLSMTYLQEQTLQLAKLPDGYQYHFIVDDAGFTMSQRQVGDTLSINIIPNAVGKSAIIVEVIDTSRNRQLVVVIDVDVQFQASYQLTTDSPFLIQTFGGDWRLNHDRAVVDIDVEDNCHGRDNCLAKYILTVDKKTNGSQVRFSSKTKNYPFKVTTE